MKIIVPKINNNIIENSNDDNLSEIEKRIQ
jgi:hypothetical protein